MKTMSFQYLKTSWKFHQCTTHPSVSGGSSAIFRSLSAPWDCNQWASAAAWTPPWEGKQNNIKIHTPCTCDVCRVRQTCRSSTMLTSYSEAFLCQVILNIEMLKDSDCCVFRALGRYDMSSIETFLFVGGFGGGVPCWERVGMEFFQPVQRQNSFVDLKLAPATPSIKEVIHAVANYKNTAAQSLFSHPPPHHPSKKIEMQRDE